MVIGLPGDQTTMIASVLAPVAGTVVR